MNKFKINNNISFENLPKTAGVYCFAFNSFSKEGFKNEVIYIGKAINIKDRVKSHFLQPSYRDNLFIKKVKKIGFIETKSEIEALILEANLIRKYKPKFNVVWRDDKNYFYVAIDKNNQDIPYIYITHQPKLSTIHYEIKTNYIGPFVDGAALKKTLKYLRKAFPFYTSNKHPKNKCSWCHLELCPGPELFENSLSPKATAGLQEYKKNIKKLALILKGEKKSVLNSLKKEMHVASKKNKFEEAAKIRDKIQALENIIAHKNVISSQKTGDNEWKTTEERLKELLNLKGRISRIECYDISNIQGKQATGSMVVFRDGQPEKNQYKKFKIIFSSEPNDIAMLKEVLTRRFNHKEWPNPEVILIDGGIAQINAAITVKNQHKRSQNIKVISIAKRYKQLYIEGRKDPLLLKKLPQSIYNLVIYLDDEAHRFAISYHKLLRKKKLIG